MERGAEIQDPFGLGEVTPITAFVTDKDNNEETKVDLGETRFEVIRDEQEATSTKAKTLTEADMKDSFGDLPKDCWEDRLNVEQHFLAAGPTEKHIDVKGKPFKNVKRTIIVGTNGYMAWALECDDTTKFVLDEEGKKSLEQEIADSKEYAKCNPAAAYKGSLSGLEQNAFIRHMNFDIYNTQTSNIANQKVKEMSAIAKVDKSLVGALRILGPKLSKQLKTLPETIREPKPIGSQERPGNRFCGVTHWEEKVSTFEEEEESTNGTDFKILQCQIPYIKTKLQAGKRSDKKKNQTKVIKTNWKDSEYVLNCMPNTIPCGCFNDTHLAIMYQPAGTKDTGMLRLCIFDATQPLEKPEKTFEFAFPERFSMGGMICTALSKEGIFSTSLSAGAIVFDTKSDSEPIIHALWLSIDDIKEGEEDPKQLIRYVTSLSFSQDDSKLLVLGTDKGECHIVNWETGEQYNIEHLPAVEPVFAASHTNDHTFMESVMGVLVCRPTVPVPVFIDMDRPIAYDTCGSLIAIMTKYGGLKFFNKKVRRVMHACVPESQAGKCNINNTQHAYQGIKLFEKSVVCVYPNGIVRKYELIR